MARSRAVVAGAAGHQSAHAVADVDQLFDRTRPRRDQRRQPVGQFAAVAGDVAAAVVTEADRRVPPIAGQRPAQPAAGARPAGVAQTQAVDKQQQPAGRVRQGRGQRRRVGGQIGPVAAKGHR